MTCLDCGDDRPSIGGRLDREEFAAFYRMFDSMRAHPKPDEPFKLPEWKNHG